MELSNKDIKYLSVLLKYYIFYGKSGNDTYYYYFNFNFLSFIINANLVSF